MFSTKSQPEISVVLPAYNVERYIAEAIESILKQTFSNFELIIIDDGSTDRTSNIISSFTDKRIIVKKFQSNKGCNIARNMGIAHAKGRYICVMDSDDIAIDTRIEKQFNFMEEHSEYGICGSYTRIHSSSETLTPPTDYEEIKVWLLSNIVFKHPTIFIRKAQLDKYKLQYDPDFRYASDYDLLVKSSKFFPITNISEYLLIHRIHPKQISIANWAEQGKFADMVRINQLINNFGFKPTDEEIRLHLNFVNRATIESEDQLKKLVNWTNKLIHCNNKYNYYDDNIIREVFTSLLRAIYRDYKLG
jgi:glycosyltransferase involved in cell wall biosynthesis